MFFSYRKDHVGHEHSAAKRWPENWGFLIGQYKIVSISHKIIHGKFILLDYRGSIHA